MTTSSFLRPLSQLQTQVSAEKWWHTDSREQVPLGQLCGKVSPEPAPGGALQLLTLEPQPLWASLEPGGWRCPWQSPLQGVKLTLVSVLGSWVRLQSSAQLISSVCALVSGFRELEARVALAHNTYMF